MEKAVSGISNLSLNELKELVDVLIEEKLSQFLGDPDSGLELREEVKERLRKSLKAQRKGEEGIPLEEVAKRLGFE